jgi:hypothetical protein
VCTAAEELARSIEGSPEQARALSAIAQALAQAQQWELLLDVVQYYWLLAETRDYICRLLFLSYNFMVRNPQLGISLYEAFAWVNGFINE